MKCPMIWLWGCAEECRTDMHRIEGQELMGDFSDDSGLVEASSVGETEAESSDETRGLTTETKDGDTKLVDALMKASRLMRQRLASLADVRKAIEEKRNDQMRCLKLLELKDEMTQKEMADLLGMRLRILDAGLAEMEKGGYVVREKPEEDDMRAVVVRMSTSGHEAVEQGIPESNEGAIIPALSAEDRQDLVELLSEVNAALESLGLSDQDRRSQESHGYGSPSTGHYDRGGHSYGRDDHSRGGYGRDDRGGRGGYGRDSRGHDDRGGHGGY